MTLHQMLFELRTRGVTLTQDGDRLAYSPRSAVPPELLAAIREHKADLLSWLATGRLPCDHLDPTVWVRAAGVARCPGCAKYMGRIAS